MDKLTRHRALAGRKVKKLSKRGLPDRIKLRRVSELMSNESKNVWGGVDVKTLAREPVSSE